jgi:Flp pilus assembly protein TadD
VADVIVPAIIVGLALVAAGVLLVRWPRAGFLTAWFFLTLAPTTSIVPIASEVGAERRLYLPLAGLVVLAVTSAYVGLRRWYARPRPMLLAAGVAVAVLLAVGTVLRNREYADPLTLARTTVTRWPSGRAHLVFGNLLEKHGDRDQALAELRRGAALYRPGEYMLGVTLVEMGRQDEGLTHLREFLRVAPANSAVIGAHDLIGRLLSRRGDLDGASREFEQLLVIGPRNVRAMVALGDVRFQQKRLPEAITLYQRARGLDSSVGRDPAVMKRLGDALAVEDRLPEAVRVFAAAAAVYPNDAALQKLWGRALAATGRYAAAAERLRRAAALAPDDLEAQALVDAIETRVGVVGQSPAAHSSVDTYGARR